MRPVRTIAAALLVASVAVAGCSTRDTSPPSDAAPAAAAPTTPAPDQPTPDQPTRRPPMARPPSTAATSQPPRILQVATHPKLSEMNGRLLLPDRVEVEVLATGVDRARLVLTPTGTAAAYHSKVVAETTPAEDGLWLVCPPRHRRRLPRVGPPTRSFPGTADPGPGVAAGPTSRHRHRGRRSPACGNGSPLAR
jgi:glucose/arabinose dehydrogenase